MLRRTLLAAASVLPFGAAGAAGAQGTGMETPPVTPETFLSEIIRHPAFGGRGRLILPRWDDRADLPLSEAGRLMPWHGQLVPEDMAEALGFLIREFDAGRRVLCSFYGEDESRRSPEKARTGLFFFRGKKGAPFAVVCPGGGFAYVGSLHEGFPIARALAGKGFNAFVLRYRTGGARPAMEDLAAAVAWIFGHAEELGVSTRCYSAWGGSAGARMAAYLGSYGPGEFGGGPLPRPGFACVNYTGHTDWTRSDPPTCTAVSRNDPIASWRTMAARLEAMRRAGIPVKMKLCETAGHGFGLGTGSDAEGWLDEAAAFWEEAIRKDRGS